MAKKIESCRSISLSFPSNDPIAIDLLRLMAAYDAMSPTRSILPARRAQVTHKVRVGNRRTLYLSTHAASLPLELFVRVRGQDCTGETVELYDCLTRLASVALQYGA